MNIDKNLFLYDLAVVAIMKNEGPYVKEWLDYHLLAGVDHFFIFDNESEDNLKKILQPYIDKGIVTYELFPGKILQTPAYDLAINKFRFYCRYIAFIDTDEFIFPKSSSNIVGVVDEIFSYHESIAGLVINWHCFGSNYQDKADYSKGVLERFTRRAPNDWTPKIEGWPEHIKGGNALTKNILNPRKVKCMDGPHNGVYFENCYMVNEQGRALPGGNNYPVTANKIVLNHYNTKTREEYTVKIRRGNPHTGETETYCNDETFKFNDRNEEFDDEILKYRDARRSVLIPKGGGQDLLDIFAVTKKINYEKILTALMQNLSPTFSKNAPTEFFNGKMETFLTCFAVAAYLKENVLSETAGAFLEETSLEAVYKTLSTNIQLHDIRLLISVLPNILALDYPVVEDIRKACVAIISQLKNLFRFNQRWKEYSDLDDLFRMLTVFDKYEHI